MPTILKKRWRNAHRTPMNAGNKYIALAIVVWLALALLAGFGARSHEHELSSREIHTRLADAVEAQRGSLSRQIERRRRDVRFLAGIPRRQSAARDPLEGVVGTAEHSSLALETQTLCAQFEAFAVAYPEVTEIALLGVTDQVRPLIRVARNAGALACTALTPTQPDLAQSIIYQRAQKLAEGQVLVTGPQRGPGRPGAEASAQMRFFTPVKVDANGPHELMLLTVDASWLLDSMRPKAGEQLTSYVLGPEGDFVLLPDGAHEYPLGVGGGARPWDEFARSAGDPKHADVEHLVVGGREVYAVRSRIALNNGEPSLSIVVTTPADTVTRSVRDVGLSVLLAATAGGAVALALAYTLRGQRRRLDQQNLAIAAIVESSQDAIIGKNLDSVITSWNRGAQQIFGYEASEAIGRPILMLIPMDRRGEEDEFLARIKRGETVNQFETVRIRKDGRLIDVSVTLSPIRDAKGRVIGASKVARDISPRKAAEARLLSWHADLERQVQQRTAEIQQLGALQRAILANATYGFIATDVSGKVTLFNPAAEDLLGYRAEEVVGKVTPALWHDLPEVAERAEQFARALGRPVLPGIETLTIKSRLGLPNQHEWTFIRKDGCRVPVRLAVSALRDEKGELNGFIGITVDISQQHTFERELISARDQLERAAHVAGLGIFTWNLGDNTLHWNTRMFEIYQQPRELAEAGLSYDRWRERLHPEDAELTLEALRRTLAGEGDFTQIFRIVRPDGAIRHIQPGSNLEYDANGQVLRMTGINVDITERIEHESALRAAKERADAASAAKSAFVANMSHEIRTPMNAILGMLQLIQRSELDPRLADYAAKAEAAGRALLGILNDVLDFSKIEASKLSLDLHPVYLERLLNDVATFTSMGIGDKDVELLFDLDGALPATVMLDALRLRQVLVNLIGNAIKFTATGEVVARMRLVERRGHRVAIEFSVSDTGIGISPEQRDRIFASFSQAETSTARQYGGTGLGLAISQALVRLMGGELAVESERERGSKFSFVIECDCASSPIQSDRPGVPSESRCLIVDDNPHARAVVAELVSQIGWQPDGAADSEQALAMAHAAREEGRPYRVLLVDWRMPGSRGGELGARLRELLPHGEGAMIALVTAQERATLLEFRLVKPQVFDGVLAKPVLPTALLEVLAEAFSPRLPEGASLKPPPVPPRRLIGLRILLVEDNPTNQQVGHDLLSDEGASVQVAADGRAGIEACVGPEPPFDVVLMDIQMPGVDGYTATRAIRETFARDRLPIIAMTANASPQDRAAALEAGMNDHVGKPFELDVLVATVQRQVGREVTARPSVPTATTSGTTGPLDTEGALFRFGGNRRVLRDALQSFGRDLPYLLSSLPVAAEPSRQELHATLHTIKGLASTVGATRLAMLANRAMRAPTAPRTVEAWQELRASLLAEASEVLRAAHDACQRLKPSDPAEESIARVIPFPRKELEQLKTLLEEGNMRALGFYDELRTHLPANDQGTDLSKLDSAMGQLDFRTAATLCANLLRDERVSA